MEKTWIVYILLCKDGTFYTGITNDLPRRLAAHAAGKGAKYTKGRTPVTLRYFRDMGSKSQALKEEYRIKQLTRQQKAALCDCNCIGEVK